MDAPRGRLQAAKRFIYPRRVGRTNIAAMPHRPIRPDPYCAFKDDRERRRALVARDVRLVLIAVVAAFAGPAAAILARLL